jgi:hypothetical protein
MGCLIATGSQYHAQRPVLLVLVVARPILPKRGAGFLLLGVWGPAPVKAGVSPGMEVPLAQKGPSGLFGSRMLRADR